MTTKTKTAETPPPAAPGRPAGAPNITETADAIPSACNKCGSTRRAAYTNRREQPFQGVYRGAKYNRIVRHSTRCLDCQQTRIDRTFEMIPAVE